MVNTSTEYQNKISGDRKFYLYADITLSDGTVLNLDDTDIMQGGMEFEDAVSGTEYFQVGAAIINKNTITLNNYKGKFDNYDFTDATVVPYVGLQLSSTVEKLKKGYFTVDEPNAVGNIITLESLDNMVKFEKPFKDVALIFPTTAGFVLTAICNYCGVEIATPEFTNYDFTIQSRPIDEAISCLDMVSYIATIAGCYARCNIDGALELKWYDLTVFECQNSVDGGYFDPTTQANYQSGTAVDGGNFVDYTTGSSVDGGTFLQSKNVHHLFDFGSSPTVAVDDVVITGVQVSDNAETPNTVLFGSTGYVISITGNPLVQSQTDAQTIANTVGAKIVGMRFRPLTASILSNPMIEAGDPAYVSVRTSRGYNTYQTFITSLSFKINSRESISCNAETPSRNSSTRYSETTKAIVEARKKAEQKLSDYDLTVQQLTNLITNGFGIYKTEIKDDNGGIIYYMHDKPLMSDSSVRWFMTSEGMIEQNQVSGQWVTVSGTDKHGNALYNVLYARKISADYIRTGKIFSDDGSVLIDMAYGVANSDNLSFIDNIQSGFPLAMPFNIDDNVSKINKVLLKYTQQNFRTYSDITDYAGSSVVSSRTGGVDVSTGYAFPSDISTSSADGSTGTHSHTIYLYHKHAGGGHSHDVDLPAHSHSLSFGIQEQAISDYNIDIYVNGTQRASISDQQGIIDLTAYITAAGWHTIELRSTSLKRVSAQINIKSYIKS